MIVGDINQWTEAIPGSGTFSGNQIGRRIGNNITSEALTNIYSHKATNTDSTGGAYITLAPDWSNAAVNSGRLELVAFGRGSGSDANAVIFKTRTGANTATEIARIGSTGLTVASAYSLFFGSDIQLSRGAANRLDLASGDSLNLVSGNITLAQAGASMGADTTTNYIKWGSGIVNMNASGGGVNINLDTDNDAADAALRIYNNAVDAGGTELYRFNESGQAAFLTTGSSGGIILGGDAQIFRGDTNRVDIAAGDSLRITNSAQTNWIDINGDHVTTPGTGPGSGFAFNTAELYSNAADSLALASGDSFTVLNGNITLATAGNKLGANTTTNYLSWASGVLNLNASAAGIRLNMDTDNDTTNATIGFYKDAADAAGTLTMSIGEAGDLLLPLSTSLIRIGGDVQISRGAADRLDLDSGDSMFIVNQGSAGAPSFQIGDNTTGLYYVGPSSVGIGSNLRVENSIGLGVNPPGTSATIQFGADVILSRGAADRLDLASGDSLNIVNGNVLLPTNDSKVGQDASLNYIMWGSGDTNINSSGQNININLDSDNDSTTTTFNVYKNSINAGGTLLMKLHEDGQLRLPITGSSAAATSPEELIFRTFGEVN